MYWMKVNLGEPQWGKIFIEEFLVFISDAVKTGAEEGHCVLKWVLPDISVEIKVKFEVIFIRF